MQENTRTRKNVRMNPREKKKWIQKSRRYSKKKFVQLPNDTAKYATWTFTMCIRIVSDTCKLNATRQSVWFVQCFSQVIEIQRAFINANHSKIITKSGIQIPDAFLKNGNALCNLIGLAINHIKLLTVSSIEVKKQQQQQHYHKYNCESPRACLCCTEWTIWPVYRYNQTHSTN